MGMYFSCPQNDKLDNFNMNDSSTDSTPSNTPTDKTEQDYWRKCVTCKSPIALGAKYYKCSVSSCDKKSAPTQFCKFECWSVHNEVYRHRNAAAEEETAPRTPDPLPKPVSKLAGATKSSGGPSPTVKEGKIKTDTLVVVSKVKKYIQDRADMNTSADTMDALTRVVTQVCDQAIKNAIADGRKTVMGRDVPGG